MLVASFPTKQSLRTAPCHSMALIPTTWGICGVTWVNHEDESTEAFVERPAGALLCRIITPGLSPAETREALLRHHPGCGEVFGDGRGNFHPEVVPEWFPELTRFLQGYYAALLRHWSLPRFADNWAFWKPRLDGSQLTAFQRQVLEVVATIPSGRRLTYGQVAARIGKPAASRAVGAAIGSNPWPVLVPCHRVVGSTGKLTGFSAPGGVEAKRRMLELEQDEPGLMG
jgi:O-6-methylguanine DNA methyltransferase